MNDELAAVSDAVAAIPLLKPGGRLCVISFHSLEDRIVKQELAKDGQRLYLPAGISRLYLWKNAPGSAGNPENRFCRGQRN